MFDHERTQEELDALLRGRKHTTQQVWTAQQPSLRDRWLAAWIGAAIASALLAGALWIAGAL